MSLKVVFPPWINDNKVPTVRNFYTTLFRVLQEQDIQFDIVPDYDRLSNKWLDMIPEWLPFFHIPGTYEQLSQYDHTITYHTRNPENINVKISYLPNYFYFDELGYAGWSMIENSQPEYQSLEDNIVEMQFENIRQSVIEDNISKYDQPKQEDSEDLPDSYIFLPTQVENDEVSKLAYVEIYDLLKSCIRKVPDLGYDLVIKRHPECESPKIEELLDKASSQNNIHVVDKSVHDLIDDSEAVLTVNSGVGFEALLHEKPVINFGRADYHWVTTTFRSETAIQDIQEVIENFDEKNRHEIRQFVVFFLNNCLVNINNEDSFIRALSRFGIQ